jgi:hypothetical protein
MVGKLLLPTIYNRKSMNRIKLFADSQQMPTPQQLPAQRHAYLSNH